MSIHLCSGKSPIPPPRNVQYELVALGAETYARVIWEAGNADSEANTRFRLVWGPAAHDPRISAHTEPKSDWGPAPRPAPEFSLASAFFLLQRVAPSRSRTADQQEAAAQRPSNNPEYERISSSNSDQSAPNSDRPLWSGVVTLDQLNTLPIELDRSFVAVVDSSVRSYLIGPLEPRRLYVVQVDAISTSMRSARLWGWGGWQQEEVVFQSRSVQLLVYSGDALRIRSVDLPSGPSASGGLPAADRAQRPNTRLPHRSRRPGRPSLRPAKVTASPIGAVKSGADNRPVSRADTGVRLTQWLLLVTAILCSQVLLAFRA